MKYLINIVFIFFVFFKSYGQEPGTVKSWKKISDLTNGFSGVLEDGDYFGISATQIGDLNKDGIQDVAIGAIDPQGTGSVFIFFLDSNGEIKSYKEITRNVNGFPNDDLSLYHFGQSICSIGDLDEDGNPDIAIGVPNSVENGIKTGAIYITFLNKDGSVKKAIKITEGVNGFNGTLTTEDRFGWSLAAIGDINENGNLEIVVGAPEMDEGANNSGAIWILSLDKNGIVESYKKISSQNSVFNSGIAGGDYFGSSVTELPDIDGNGKAEIIVGAKGDDDGKQNSGSIWLIFLNSQISVDSVVKISQTVGNFSDSLKINAAFGTSLTNIGDLDGNEIHDLIVCGEGQTVSSGGNGSCWTVLLDENGKVLNNLKLLEKDNDFLNNLELGDFFGSSVSLLPDIDGDNVPEVIIGSYRDDDGGQNKGAAYLLFLNGQPQVSIKEPFISNSLFKIYPNPATEEIFLQPKDQKINRQSLKIKAYDLLGQLVLQDQVFPSFNDTYHLNTTALKTGIYHLVIETKDQVIKEKILISR